MQCADVKNRRAEEGQKLVNKFMAGIFFEVLIDNESCLFALSVMEKCSFASRQAGGNNTIHHM